jgi:transposase
VGKTKRGKGTKIMAIADCHGLPVAVCIESASPHEVKLVQKTAAEMLLPDAPAHLIGDAAYDSDGLDQTLADCGVNMIAPNRENRKNKTQDRRHLARYRRRWKIERLFAWLQNFRRLVTRYERHAENFLGMIQLACALILLKHL